MSANGQSTATVETLTATVNALVVGSRQVTLSVARQLDEVPLTRVEVFGRVRLGKAYVGDYVIGRDRNDGSLVVACYESHPRADITLKDVEKPMKICGSVRSRGYTYIRFEGVPLRIDPDASIKCLQYHSTACPEIRCDDLIELRGPIEPLLAAIARFHVEAVPHEAARTAPLIVLAGLR